MLRMATSETAASRVSWLSRTFMLIRSLASTSSVARMAVCLARVLPRLSACCLRMFSVVRLVTSQKTHIASTSRTQLLIANLAPIFSCDPCAACDRASLSRSAVRLSLPSATVVVLSNSVVPIRFTSVHVTPALSRERGQRDFFVANECIFQSGAGFLEAVSPHHTHPGLPQCRQEHHAVDTRNGLQSAGLQATDSVPQPAEPAGIGVGAFGQRVVQFDIARVPLRQMTEGLQRATEVSDCQRQLQRLQLATEFLNLSRWGFYDIHFADLEHQTCRLYRRFCQLPPQPGQKVGLGDAACRQLHHQPQAGSVKFAQQLQAAGQHQAVYSLSLPVPTEGGGRTGRSAVLLTQPEADRIVLQFAGREPDDGL